MTSKMLPFFWFLILMLSVIVWVRVSIAKTKHHNKKNGFIQLLLPYYCSSLKEVRTRIQTGQDLGGRSCYRPLRGAAYWLGSHGLLGTTHNGLGPLPHWSLIEKNPCSYISWRHILNWGSFPSGDSCLHQVNIKPASTLDFLSQVVLCAPGFSPACAR